MSDALVDRGSGLRMSAYAGPVRPDGGKRRRYQIHQGAQMMDLSREEAVVLALGILNHEGIASPPERVTP